MQHLSIYSDLKWIVYWYADHWWCIVCCCSSERLPWQTSMLNCVTQLLKYILSCGTTLHYFYTKLFVFHFKLVVNTADKNCELIIIINVSAQCRIRTETFTFDTQLDLFSDNDRRTIHYPAYYSVTCQRIEDIPPKYLFVMILLYDFL